MSILTRPSAHYKHSYLQAMREFQGEGRYVTYNLRRIDEHFDDYVRQLYQQEERDRTTPERVPSTEFWLIDHETFIGRLNLRHRLNGYLLRVVGHIGYEIRPTWRRRGYGIEILRLGLLEARTIGLKRVLVTCDEDNIGSRRIIEHNGGIFENAAIVEGSPQRKLRYWITLE